MERDEETGLSYHTARFYMPWLGRWCSGDPEGLADGLNIFRYSLSNPIVLEDPHGTQTKNSSQHERNVQQALRRAVRGTTAQFTSTHPGTRILLNVRYRGEIFARGIEADNLGRIGRGSQTSYLLIESKLNPWTRLRRDSQQPLWSRLQRAMEQGGGNLEFQLANQPDSRSAGSRRAIRRAGQIGVRPEVWYSLSGGLIADQGNLGEVESAVRHAAQNPEQRTGRGGWLPRLRRVLQRSLQEDRRLRRVRFVGGFGSISGAPSHLPLNFGDRLEEIRRLSEEIGASSNATQEEQSVSLQLLETAANAALDANLTSLAIATLRTSYDVVAGGSGLDLEARERAGFPLSSGQRAQLERQRAEERNVRQIIRLHNVDEDRAREILREQVSARQAPGWYAAD